MTPPCARNLVFGLYIYIYISALCNGVWCEPVFFNQVHLSTLLAAVSFGCKPLFWKACMQTFPGFAFACRKKTRCASWCRFASPRGWSAPIPTLLFFEGMRDFAVPMVSARFYREAWLMFILLTFKCPLSVLQTAFGQRRFFLLVAGSLSIF